MAKRTANSIEQSFIQLGEITEKLEDDSLSLEDTFDLYQQGMKLVKACNQSIDDVEKKLIILTKKEVKDAEL